jgi:NADH:ubiquinone oxidoreductase subunit 4 (subunit M)
MRFLFLVLTFFSLMLLPGLLVAGIPGEHLRPLALLRFCLGNSWGAVLEVLGFPTISNYRVRIRPLCRGPLGPQRPSEIPQLGH